MTSPSTVRTALVAAAIVGAAGAATWYLTRSAPAPAAPASGHNHAAMAGGGAGEREVQLSDADQRRIGVTFAPVVAGPLEREVRVVAQVAFDESRTTVVTPRTEGYVEKLHASFTGQQVRAGQPLLEMHAPMLTAAAEEYLLARRLEADLAGGSEEARANAERLTTAARDRLRLFGLPEQQLEHLEHTGAPRRITLYAPSSGVILEKNVVEGQRVMMGDPLFRIADLGTVWLEGDVFEQDLGTARLGTEVTAEFTALPGQPRHGRISYVAPSLNLETRTGRIRVALANPGLVLKPGMFATLRFTAPAAGPAVLSVPRSAVLSTGQRNLVFVKRPDGRFTPTDVTLGVQTEDRIVILGGLATGDTVVASATFLVDAESNLGSLLGGMGDMPGMDMTAPAAPPPTPSPRPGSPAPKATTPPAPTMDAMPGMDMPAPAPAPAPAHDHSGHGG